MKFASILALTLMVSATPIVAQTVRSAGVAVPASADVKASTTARLNLDTPIETVVADVAGKKVLDTDLPSLTTNEHYDMIKSMSLNQLAGLAPDKLTPERLAKVNTDLAVIK